MSHGITLASYLIHVNHLGTSEEEFLTSFDGTHDLLELFDSHLSTISATPVEDSENSRQLRVSAVDTVGSRTRFVHVLSGEFGLAAEGRRRGDDSHSYDRTPDDVELVPQFLLLHVPRKSKRGILLVQRVGVRSPYSGFARYFNSKFRDEFGDYRLSFDRFVPGALLEELTEGFVNGLTFRLHKLPKDLASIVSSFGNPDQMHHVHIEIRPVKGKHFTPSQSLAKLIGDPKKTHSGLSFPTVLGVPAKAGVLVEYNGRNRKVLLANPEDAAPYLDVTEELQTLDGSHPAPTEIRTVMINHLKDICNDLQMPHV